jgi:hypothetical protein
MPAHHRARNIRRTIQYVPILSLALVAAAFVTLAGTAPQTINVHAGDDLQRALDAARPGTTIALDPGVTFVGNFVLPMKAGSDTQPIVVRTSGADMPPGQRISPDAARMLAKIRTPNSSPALRTQPGARFWLIELLEISSAFDGGGEIVSLGDGGPAQRTLADVPSDLVMDRVYVHGVPAAQQRRGIGLNAQRVTVRNSYVSEIKGRGYDTQALGGANGPGDYLIENNFFEASGENIMFGGADPHIPNLVPTHIVVRGNTFSKPVQWRDSSWEIKNLFELKNARDVTIDGNIFERNWLAAQTGFSILFTVRNQDGACPWCDVSQVTFENNIVRDVAAGINILGTDYTHPSAQTKGITIRNNLMYGIDSKKWGGNGYALAIQGGPRDVTIDHNTIVQENASGILQVEGPPVIGFAFTNNLVQHSAYGIIGRDRAPGNDSLSMYFPSGVVTANAIAGADASRYPSRNRYPSATEFRQEFASYADGDYRLASGSALRGAGTDGTDIGVLFRTLVRDPGTNRDRQ